MNPLSVLRPAARHACRRALSTSSRRTAASPSDVYGSARMPRLRPDDSPSGELAVGELQGAKFRVEPLRRVGETDATKRARLLCSSPPLSSPPTKKKGY